ncbi:MULTISPECIES: sensor domain-containing diguanylate cyclase [unclassified Pseudoalteromonas]|uniref:sensor domain-containing diguanylate cyclase n=1 Tax=unclassified Pseudoalteromonas TaxID=194690 RepID=UPI00301541D6
MSGYSYESLYDLALEDLDWERWQKLVNSVASLFNSPVAFINQASHKGIEVLIASELPTTHYSPGGSASMDINVYCHTVVKNNSPLYVQNAASVDAWQNNPELTEDNYVSYLGYPIHWPDGKCFGTLCVMDTAPTNYKKQFFDILEVLRDVISGDLAHLYKESELKIESRLDPLTNIYNRRGFEEAFEPLQQLSSKLNRKAQLIFIDLNNFKLINDTLGHEAGDQVLKRFANILRSCTRKTDLLCRWGGDEFIVVLNNDEQVAIQNFMKRIESLQDEEHKKTGMQKICFSIGNVEILPKNSKSLSELLHQADQLMYSCKAS